MRNLHNLVNNVTFIPILYINLNCDLRIDSIANVFDICNFHIELMLRHPPTTVGKNKKKILCYTRKNKYIDI